jgi:hypothetical protein
MEQMAEEASLELHREAGLDPEDAPGAIDVAFGVLGGDCFRVLPPGALSMGAALCRIGGRWFIYYSPSLTGHRLNHAIGHELGHYFIARQGMKLENEEEVADRIGASVCAPMPAFARAVRERGPALRALADQFALSLAGTALRIGECTDVSTAVVESPVVRFRGRPWPWPTKVEMLSVSTLAGTKRRALGRGCAAFFALNSV